MNGNFDFCFRIKGWRVGSSLFKFIIRINVIFFIKIVFYIILVFNLFGEENISFDY